MVSFPQVSPPKPCICLSSPYVLHDSPSHDSQFYHLHNTGWVLQIIKLLLALFSPLPCYLVPLRPLNILHQHLNLRSSLNVSDQVSHPYKTTGKIIALYILIFIFSGSKPEDKNSAPNNSMHSLTLVCSSLYIGKYNTLITSNKHLLSAKAVVTSQAYCYVHASAAMSPGKIPLDPLNRRLGLNQSLQRYVSFTWRGSNHDRPARTVVTAPTEVCCFAVYLCVFLVTAPRASS